MILLSYEEILIASLCVKIIVISSMLVALLKQILCMYTHVVQNHNVNLLNTLFDHEHIIICLNNIKSN